ncbi:MAG: aminotransferase class I/II-fold pyridoxal phosphate-dependent enzyme, partial [Deltaproteobacteria bacterium]|nr:aminotransferase class I/II-fold pyridoxal phosphate-dependent enzyme [Deltaproteobacteria bacterium]
MKVRKAIRQMETYSPPLEMRAERDYLLLDFNESTQDPPQVVNQAIADCLAAGRLRKYPSYKGLIDGLSRYVGTPAENLLITNGSDSAIQVIMHALLEDGDEVVFPRPGFAIFRTTALTMGAQIVSPLYREPEMEFPLEEIKAAVTPRTRLIVVINPNNPTGTSPGPGQIEDLLKSFPEICVLVDEA